MDFNEVCLHESTLNLHMHAWIFSRLSLASVDNKQHLSEVVFSALVGFSLYTTSTHHRVNHQREYYKDVLCCLCDAVWCKRPDFWPTITTMLQRIDRWEKIHTCIWKFKVASSKHALLKSTRFFAKINRSSTFLTDLMYCRGKFWVVLYLCFRDL